MGGSGQVPVLHLPSMVQHVVRGVAEQVWDRPLPEWLAGRVPVAHRIHEVVSVGGKAAWGTHFRFLDRHADRFEKSSPSTRKACPTISSRARPPPRTPGRSSGETRVAVSSNSAQAARRSPTLRSKTIASNGSRSSGEGANEMPQKSVEPVPG